MSPPTHPAGPLIVEDLALARAGHPLGTTVSFTVGPGERLVVRGPSGAGKSTLLRDIVGFEPPTSGRVTLDGRSPEDWGWPRFRTRVIYVHQSAALFGGTVADNLAMPFSYAELEGRALDRDVAEGLLARLGLEGVWEREARDLSGGEAQRLVLARALLLTPAFLLLDEPSAGLDAATATRVAAELRQACDDGLGLVLVSHDEDFITSLEPTGEVRLNPSAASAA